MNTQTTANGLATSSEPTFRTYEPRQFIDERTGRLMEMQLCEEWVEGRWEGFFTDARPVESARAFSRN